MKRSVLVGCFTVPLCLFCSAADAVVIYSGPQFIAVQQFSSQSIDLDGGIVFQQTQQQMQQFQPRPQEPQNLNSDADVELDNFVFIDGNFQGVFIPYEPGSVGGSGGLNNNVARLNPGELVDDSLIGTGMGVGTLGFGLVSPGTEFENVTDAYFGFGFPINGVNHFAWMRLDVDNSGGTLIIKDWAYETTPGLPIAAGSTVSVPEPSAFALSLTALCLVLRSRAGGAVGR